MYIRWTPHQLKEPITTAHLIPSTLQQSNNIDSRTSSTTPQIFNSNFDPQTTEHQLQNVYLPHRDFHWQHQRLRRHRRPPQPRTYDQDSLPRARQLLFRVWRQGHIRNLHRDRQEAHWPGKPTPQSYSQPKILTNHRQHTSSPSPTSPTASTPSSTQSRPLVS